MLPMARNSEPPVTVANKAFYVAYFYCRREAMAENNLSLYWWCLYTAREARQSAVKTFAVYITPAATEVGTK